MGKITLAGSVPGEATNGLSRHSKEFIDRPMELVPVIAMVAVNKITQKPETGEEYPTLRIHHVEVVPERHRKAFATMLGDALADRTGQPELPFAPGEELPRKDPFPEDEEFAERALEVVDDAKED